jgi:hypothetical protein
LAWPARVFFTNRNRLFGALRNPKRWKSRAIILRKEIVDFPIARLYRTSPGRDRSQRTVRRPSRCRDSVVSGRFQKVQSGWSEKVKRVTLTGCRVLLACLRQQTSADRPQASRPARCPPDCDARRQGGWKRIVQCLEDYVRGHDDSDATADRRCEGSYLAIVEIF